MPGRLLLRGCSLVQKRFPSMLVRDFIGCVGPGTAHSQGWSLLLLKSVQLKEYSSGVSGLFDSKEAASVSQPETTFRCCHMSV